MNNDVQTVIHKNMIAMIDNEKSHVLVPALSSSYYIVFMVLALRSLKEWCGYEVCEGAKRGVRRVDHQNQAHEKECSMVNRGRKGG